MYHEKIRQINSNLNLRKNKFVTNVPGTEYHDNKKGVLGKPSGTQWFLYIPCVLIVRYCVFCPHIGICTGASGSVVG